MLPAYNKFKKNVSKTSSSLCPKAILLHPSRLATLFKIPLLKLAHSEHGFFSFRMSKTISFVCENSSKNGTFNLSHKAFRLEESKNSKPGFIVIPIISNFFG